MSVRPIYQDKREVGKHVKSSKVLFLWKFNMDERDYTIELYYSMLSGKKKITQNGQIIYENNSYQGAFNFPFSIGRNSLSIVQHGDRFELRINNQSFDHLYNQKMTKHHFASDNFGASSSSSYSRSGQYGGYGDGGSSRGPRAPPKNHRADEDEEIRKAIELSKQTAKKEEEARKKKLQASRQANSGDKDDFDIGAGFEKFATGAQRGQANDIDDFDFGNIGGGSSNKKEEFKQEEEFNFDIGATQQNQAKSAAPQDSGDLMDLLSGPSTNNQQQQQQNPQNALDFFSAGGGTGQLGQAAAQNQQMGGNNPFDFSGNQGSSQASMGMSPAIGGAGPQADPFSNSTNTNSFVSGSDQQQQQQQPGEKPKFVPNPMFQAGIASNPQQQYMMQMQMQQQQQMMYYSQMGQQQQQNQMGAPGQQFATGMPGYGGGMQMNSNMMGGGGQMMGGAPQQQSNPFDFSSGGNAQQQQKPQGTPFDMF